MKLFKRVLLTVFGFSFLLGFMSRVNAGTITSVNTSQRNGYILVTGEAGNDVLAVAIMVYDKSNNLKSYETTGVSSSHKYMTYFDIPEGEYTVKVADYAGGDYKTSNVEKPISSGDGEENADLTDAILDAMGDTQNPVTNVTAGQTYNINGVDTGTVTGDVKLEVTNDYAFSEHDVSMDTALKAETIPALTAAADITAATAALAQSGVSAENVKESAAFNIDLVLLVVKDDGTETEIARVTEAGSGVTVSIDVPENLINTDPTVNRTFKVVRIHGASVEVIPNVTYNATTNKVIFKNDKFSKFIITAVDTKKTSNQEAEGISLTPSYTYMKLSWDEESSYAGYKVYRKTSSGSYSVIKKITSKTTTTYKDYSVKPNTTYYYKVKPYKVSSGKTKYGDYTSVVSGMLKKPLATTVSASNSYSYIKLTWDKKTSGRGYKIYRSTEEDGTFKLIKTITSNATTTYKDYTIKPKTTYYYKVKSYREVNGKNSLSPYSNIVNTAIKPPLATSLNSKAYSSYIKLTWDKKTSGRGYKIYRSTEEDGTFKLIKTITSNATTSYKDTSVKSGKTYYYKMRTYRVINGKNSYSDYSDIESNSIE